MTGDETAGKDDVKESRAPGDDFRCSEDNEDTDMKEEDGRSKDSVLYWIALAIMFALTFAVVVAQTFPAD